jgi:hypothetical protein
VRLWIATGWRITQILRYPDLARWAGKDAGESELGTGTDGSRCPIVFVPPRTSLLDRERGGRRQAKSPINIVCRDRG